MGEKLYRPILSEGEHLLQSTKNPGRVRGLARDENNKNPDIIEWEKVDVSDYQYDGHQGNPQEAHLSPEEEELAEKIGVALAAASVWLFTQIVTPWWKSTAWPWIRRKGREIKSQFTKKPMTNTSIISSANPKEFNCESASASKQIDDTFEQFYFDMDKEEARQHMMKTIYHMLGLANEIRTISNARIREESKTDRVYLERTKASEQYLTAKVADCINKILSDESLMLDMSTSKSIFSLLGGGVHMNGEYIPVEIEQVNKALKYIELGGESNGNQQKT
ncbi:MAG: hypothetical protein Q4F17_00800 [Eubacteriales bacterium]|nr:hypothetical protein [Eubacteriales bacterium]